MNEIYNGRKSGPEQTRIDNWRYSVGYHPSKETNFSPYLKVNQTKLNLKRQEGYMSDGTGLNLSDPNSMRD